MTITIEVGEVLAHIAHAVLVGIVEGFEASTVAVLNFHGGVVVSVIRIVDVEPDFFHRVIGAQHVFIAGTADGIAVVLGPEERAVGRESVVVEDLRESIVEGSRSVCIAVQVRPGSDDMETLA